MVLCKFYLRGNCRYGDRCWNEHQDDSQYNQVAQKGEYYVSPDSRSLWRKDQQPNFSFKQALNTSNRFGAFPQDRPQHFSEHPWDDGQQFNSFRQRGGGFGPPGNFGNAFHGPSNFQYSMPHQPGGFHQHQQRGQFQTRPPVEFSFNAAHQRNFQREGQFQTRPPVEFSFSAAHQQRNFPREGPVQIRPPVEFSFNAAHQSSLSSNRTVNPPTSFSFTGALNKLPPKDPVLFSFKNAQNQINQNSGRPVGHTPQNANNTLQPTKLFGKPASANVSASRVTKTFSTEVPSILARSDILKVVSVYSVMTQLKEWDREQFSASVFSLGKIPTVPPPQELC